VLNPRPACRDTSGHLWYTRAAPGASDRSSVCDTITRKQPTLHLFVCVACPPTCLLDSKRSFPIAEATLSPLVDANYLVCCLSVKLLRLHLMVRIDARLVRGCGARALISAMALQLILDGAISVPRLGARRVRTYVVCQSSLPRGHFHAT